MPDIRFKKQFFTGLRCVLLGTAGLALLMPLAGCGKKPNLVDPPPGVIDDAFPHTYPDPATDPKP